MRAATLAALLLLAVVAAGQTILNGDFEDLTAPFPNFWSVVGSNVQPAAASEAHSGSSAAYLGSPDNTIRQTVTGLTVGVKYEISLYVWAKTTNAGGLEVTVNSGSPVTTTLLKASEGTSGVYVLKTISFTAGKNSVVVSFRGIVFQNKKKAFTDGYYLDDITIGVCSLCGDPHIVGLDNSRYDFMGEAGMVFALLSEPSVQLNSRFVTHGKGTGIGPLCIRTCQHTLEIHPNHTVLIDGKLHAPATKSVAGKSEHIGKEIVMTQYNARMTWLSFGAWSMLLRHGKSNFDIINLKHHADHDTEDLHGVYGMSALPNHHQHDKKHCQPWKNGGCELIGKWQDYALADQTGLCGAEWTYTKFDPKKC